MEREALLKIIIQDLKELETLLSTFTGKPEIPKAFIRLAQNKAKGVLEEVDLLEQVLDLSVKSKNTITEINEIIPKTDFQENNFLLIEDHVQNKLTIEKTTEILENNENHLEKQIPKQKAKVQPATKSDKNNVTIENKDITLGEKFMQDSQSFYDTLSNKKESEATPRFMSQPIKDLKKSIGINDRFYFIRELFGGDADLYNTTIEQLQTIQDMQSAEKFVAEHFNFDESNEAVVSFKDILRRKFL